MLSLEGVCYAYAPASISFDGVRTSALSDVRFTVARGERVAVLGGNGSGKSTLIGCACGRLRPTAGTVAVDGVPFDGEEGLAGLLRSVGYVGQDPDDQMVASTLFEEVAFGPCNLGLPSEEVVRRVEEALRSCGLEGLGERVISTLSGGERQRAALAGVIAMRPGYLLCDEPCSMLDHQARRSVLGILDSAASAGCGVVHVTHELSDVLGYDRAVVVEAGRIVWEGTPVELLLDRETFERAACLGTRRLELVRGLVERGEVKPADVPRVLSDLDADAGPETRSSATGCGRRGPGDPSVGLRVRAVSYVYGTSSRSDRSDAPYALRDVDLDVAPGEIVLLCGASGSGKTTLARVAAGLYAPLEGSVEVDGANCEPGVVACAFQRAEDQLFAPTVLDDVMFGPLRCGCENGEARRRAERALSLVGLDPGVFGQLGPFSLSGGQMRRVAIAGVLALQRRYVVFDEPTVGLDARGVRAFARLLGDLAKRGVGVLVVSHDLERLAPLADRGVALRGGMLCEGGSTVEPSRMSAKAASSGTGPGVGVPGGYVAGTSVLHRLDARVKLVLLLVWTVALFQIDSPLVLFCVGVAAFAAVKMVGASPIQVARGLAPLGIALVAFVAVGALRFDGSGSWQVAGSVGVSPEGLATSLMTVARIAVLAFMTVPLTATTTATRLTDALRWFLGPFGRLRVPVDDVATMLGVALRFMPLCAGQFERVLLAQRARCARVDRGGPVVRALSWVPIAIPALVGLFRRADALSSAMVSRCYRGAGRTRLTESHVRAADVAACVIGCVLAVVCALVH